MKRRYYIAVLALAALMLSACANSETTNTTTSGNGQTSQSTQASGSDSSNAGQTASSDDNTNAADTQAGGSDASTQVDAASDSATTDNQDDDDVSEVIDLSGMDNGQQAADGSVSDASNDTSGGQTAEQTYDEVNQSGGNDTAPAKVQYEWEGTYKSETGEQVTISSQNENTFHFAFEVCLISGQAEIDGLQAIYYGDDDNQVVFNYGTDAIMIEVTNSNGDDTSESPLIGMYTKEGADTAGADEVEDTEDTTE